MTATCTLTVISGPAAGSEVEVERELIIGRRDADLTIADQELSRRHAAVRPTETGVVIEDLGSLNGTFVDGERISGAVTLTADAAIRVGISEMSLQLAIPEPEAEPQPQADDTGRTRLASAIPQTPAPIAQPQVTRVRQVPDAAGESSAAGGLAPIAQPLLTRVRQVPDAAGESSAAGGPPAPSGGEAQAKAPGIFKRLLGRIRGRGGDGEGAEG